MVMLYKRPKLKHLLYLGLPSVLLLGTVIAAAQAAPGHVKVEPEAGTLQGRAATYSDSTASEGSFVEFFEQSQPPSPGGTFTESFSSLASWTFSHWRYEIPGNDDAPSTATIDGGKLKIVTRDQNYGEGIMRSAAMYNLAQGGTVKLDVSLASGNIPTSSAHAGWPWVGFLTQPYTTPSTPHYNGGAPTPEQGVYVNFRYLCSVPWATPQVLSYSNYSESEIAASGNCLNTPTMVAGQLNRVELRYTPGRLEVWATDASVDGINFGLLKHVQDYSVTIPTTGYVYMGSHNHASDKYSSVPAIETWFDNISFPSGATTVTYPSGQAVNLSGATGARVVFTAYNQNLAGGAVIVNGHRYSFTPRSSGSNSAIGSVPISIFDLINGNNTIMVEGFTEAGNIGLVIIR